MNLTFFFLFLYFSLPIPRCSKVFVCSKPVRLQPLANTPDESATENSRYVGIEGKEREETKLLILHGEKEIRRRVEATGMVFHSARRPMSNSLQEGELTTGTQVFLILSSTRVLA